MGVPQSKTKTYMLNLNIFRNAHYQTNNKAKVTYKELMLPQVKDLPVMEKALLVYVVYPRDARKFDVANVCSIHDKFFCDALVEAGKLPEDNYTCVPDVVYRFGEIDRKNPRVLIEITPMK